jgi:hypothetical protein
VENAVENQDTANLIVDILDDVAALDRGSHFGIG